LRTFIEHRREKAVQRHASEVPMKTSFPPLLAALVLLLGLPSAPGPAADREPTAHSNQGRPPAAVDAGPDVAPATTCARWKAICHDLCFGIYDAWMTECELQSVLCQIDCVLACSTDQGVNVRCLWPCLADCETETAECRDGALEFLDDCRDVCLEARGCLELLRPPRRDVYPDWISIQTE
jgi:hypothetical protein